MFPRAANHSDRRIRAIPPAFSPERVAATVVRSVRHPRRQRTTGLTGALIVVGMRLLPRLTETVVAQLAARPIFRPESTAPTQGTLYRSEQPSAISGGWRRGRWRVRLGDAGAGSDEQPISLDHRSTIEESTVPVSAASVIAFAGHRNEERSLAGEEVGELLLGAWRPSWRRPRTFARAVFAASTLAFSADIRSTMADQPEFSSWP